MTLVKQLALFLFNGNVNAITEGLLQATAHTFRAIATVSPVISSTIVQPEDAIAAPNVGWELKRGVHPESGSPVNAQVLLCATIGKSKCSKAVFRFGNSVAKLHDNEAQMCGGEFNFQWDNLDKNFQRLAFSLDF